MLIKSVLQAFHEKDAVGSDRVEERGVNSL